MDPLSVILTMNTLAFTDFFSFIFVPLPYLDNDWISECERYYTIGIVFNKQEYLVQFYLQRRVKAVLSVAV